MSESVQTRVVCVHLKAKGSKSGVILRRQPSTLGFGVVVFCGILLLFFR